MIDVCNVILFHIGYVIKIFTCVVLVSFAKDNDNQ